MTTSRVPPPPPPARLLSVLSSRMARARPSTGCQPERLFRHSLFFTTSMNEAIREIFSSARYRRYSTLLARKSERCRDESCSDWKADARGTPNDVAREQTLIVAPPSVYLCNVSLRNVKLFERAFGTMRKMMHGLVTPVVERILVDSWQRAFSRRRSRSR